MITSNEVTTSNDQRSVTPAEMRTFLEGKFGQVWDTKQLQEDYSVEGFCSGMVVVTRKSDGVRGSLDFLHSPRFYHSFVKA